MAPKTPAMGNEEFLAACLKFCKEKPIIDFTKLAEAIGMSSGGAANKFRAIMKQLEEEGASWTQQSDSAPGSPSENATKKTTPKRKPSVKKTSKAVPAQAGNDDADNGDLKVDDDIETAPKKKAKAVPKKSAAKPRGGGKKVIPKAETIEQEADDAKSDVKEEGGVNSDGIEDEAADNEEEV